MPFEGHGRFSFTPPSVYRNAPALPGIYGLSNAKQWLFIAATDDIQAALTVHLGERDTQLARMLPTGFTFEVWDPSGHQARLNRLIGELLPVCNRRLR